MSGHRYDARSCPARVFDAYVVRFATSSGVDVSVWPIEDRRDVINAIAKKAAEKPRPFPFQFVDPVNLAANLDAPNFKTEETKAQREEKFNGRDAELLS